MADNSDILARLRALNGLLGITFAGNRDVYSTFGYPITITYPMVMNLYNRQDVASRVVDSEPNAIWSLPPEVKSDDTFVTAWNDLRARNKLHLRLLQLDKLVGLGKFAILLIGMNDDKDLDKPVGKADKVTFLRAYGEGNVVIKEYNSDERSPLYGLPKLYEINAVVKSNLTNTGNTQQAFAPKPFLVHHSRVLHIAENTLDNDIFGSNRIARVYNILQDIEKVAGGSAETYWLTSNRGLQLDLDKDMTLTEDDAADLSDEVDEYIHGLRRVIRTKGVKIESLGSDVADPRGVFNVLTALLAGATGIPQRILLGSEAGQLASEQDRANWASRIEARREIFIEPVILYPLVVKLVENKVLPIPETLSWEWPEAFRQSPLERSQTSAQQARTLSNVSKALSSDQPVVTKEEGREIIESAGSIPLFNEPADAVPEAE